RAFFFAAGSSFLLQRLEHIRIGRLEELSDLDIFLLDLVDVDLLDMHQPQKGLHRSRNIPAAFVTGTAALRNTDLRPELRLIQAELAANLAHVNLFAVFHLYFLRYKSG